MVCSPLVCSKGSGWKGLKRFQSSPSCPPSVCVSHSFPVTADSLAGVDQLHVFQR